MTADDALKTGLFVSVLVHATLFFGWGEPVRVPSSGGTVVTMELEGGGAAVSEKGGVLLEARVFDRGRPTKRRLTKSAVAATSPICRT